MSQPSSKRKAADQKSEGKAKKQKNWQTPKQRAWTKAGTEIHIGDSGIWVTCERSREGKAAAEILDLLEEYAVRFYGSSVVAIAHEEDDEDGSEPDDIEQAISSELSEMKKAKSKSLFSIIRPDIACVIFVKTRPPVDPVKLVHAICKDAVAGSMPKRCRYVMRLTPASLTEKAHERNFEDLARKVLKPVFHEDDSGSKKFAIRYSSRNNTKLARDDVIKKTAEIVGPTHKVDLTHPETVILVELYKTICTMAVVDGDYNDLKKYNLMEIKGGDRSNGSDESSRFKKSETHTDIMKKQSAAGADVNHVVDVKDPSAEETKLVIEKPNEDDG